MKTIFICYETPDLRFAERLVTDLDKRELKPWLDVREFPGGEVGELDLQRAIQTNNYFLIILTRYSVSSKDVLSKLAYARIYDKLIISVLVEDCKIPQQLQKDLSIDFRSDYRNGLQKVIQYLTSHETTIGRADNHDVVQPHLLELTAPVSDRKISQSHNVIDQIKSIELKKSRVVGDVFIGEKQTKTEPNTPERVFQVKPLVQVITISIGLTGIGYPIWWFLNNSSKDTLGYLLISLIVVLSILITLIGILAPDQLVKIILAALGTKKESPKSNGDGH